MPYLQKMHFLWHFASYFTLFQRHFLAFLGQKRKQFFFSRNRSCRVSKIGLLGVLNSFLTSFLAFDHPKRPWKAFMNFEFLIQLYDDVEVSKCILNEFLIKFSVYNMCHVSVWIFDLLLAGLLGYVIFEVHQVLLQSLEGSQSILNEFLVKSWVSYMWIWYPVIGI